MNDVFRRRTFLYLAYHKFILQCNVHKITRLLCVQRRYLLIVHCIDTLKMVIQEEVPSFRLRIQSACVGS